MASGSTSLHHSLLGPSLLKAGQDKVDQQKVGEIIYDASKGSKFFKNEERRDEELTKRIEKILAHKEKLESASLSKDLKKADEQIAQLEKDRDLSQIIVHVDCDAFFASVEELDRPELKTVPMAVGGGVLTTCNYKAREFGVRSGMAGHIAKKLCPHLIFLPINFDKYNAKAREVRSVLEKYDPRFEAASVDEAFLNITGYLDGKNITPEDLVFQMRQEVFEASKITVSAGIAPNTKIAKIASNINKPNGQFRIPNDRQAVMAFMDPLPVRKVNGIGRVFERELAAADVKTCGDIFNQRAILRQLFGEKAFSFLLNMYLGLGRTNVHPVEEYERHSVGTESTFRDLSGHEALLKKLRFTAEELEKDLKKIELSGRTLTLKVKLNNYRVYTRQRALDRAIHTANDLYNLSLPLLYTMEADFAPLKIRLMGLRVSQLVSTKKEAFDTQKWFFGHITGSSSNKRKLEQRDEEWEVWPEEEFEQAQAAEHAEQLEMMEELDKEVGEQLKNQDHPPSDTVVEQSVTPKAWDCPICNRPQPADDAAFNQHVDFCLSKQAIREAVQESATPPPPPSELPRGNSKKPKVQRKQPLRGK